VVNLLFPGCRKALKCLLTRATGSIALIALLEAQEGHVLHAVAQTRPGGCCGQTVPSTTPANVRRVDQAPHEPGVSHRRLYPGGLEFEALLVGVYENKQLTCITKVRTDLSLVFGTSSSRPSRHCKLPSATSGICLRFRSPSRRRKETLGRRSSRSPARRGPAGTWPPRVPSRAARPARLACAA
jgi:hypothetical protein